MVTPNVRQLEPNCNLVAAACLVAPDRLTVTAATHPLDFPPAVGIDGLGSIARLLTEACRGPIEVVLKAALL